MFEKVDEKIRISLKYQDTERSLSFSNVKADADADSIYETATAINSLQVDRTLESVEKVYSYEIFLD